MHDLSKTLAAVATAPGRGGIGCVRLSGPEAVAVAGRLFRARSTAPRTETGPPIFGTFVDGEGRPIDHGYLVVFPADRSYTGEPTVELWSHGSPPVLDALTRAAVTFGAVPAGPGEFTYRALRHGRLDLARAEAVRDLVAARTVYQARVAFSQVDGALSRGLAPLRESLIDLVARCEAAIEFADEAETHLPKDGLFDGLADARASARALLAGARRGRIVREGARVALSGATSVGKSSLFNRILGRERAIVSPVPGTTRDTLEETVDIAGIPVTLVDTAGLRRAGDAVEAEGVRRARTAAGEADLVLMVLDASRPPSGDENEALTDGCGDRAVASLVVANKTDLLPAGGPSVSTPGAVPVSAATGEGIDLLVHAIHKALCGGGTLEDPILTNARHSAALEAAVGALDRSSEALPLGDEIVLEEVRAALAAIGEITGEIANDDLYDRIFSTFCIGK